MVEIVIKVFENPELKETPDVFKEYRELESIQRELNVRAKVLKEEIMNRLHESNNTYKDDTYEAYIKVVESKRLDTAKVKRLFEKNKIDLSKFQTVSTSERLTIKRVD